jgi:ABC-type multidrug transport system ATPase subunit
MIELIDIHHHYSVKPTLRDINLTIPTGELLCVMGPNGMGKSTLLSVAAGLLCPIKGQIKIDGLTRRSNIEDEKVIRQKVIYLPDDPWLPLTNTGREFLFAVGRLYGVNEDRLFDHVDRLLDVFELKDRADSDISSYSTGQKKKIGICSTLVTDAPIMILDEPFSGGLDSSALLALHHILKHLVTNGNTTIMMAVPVPELVEDLANRIAVIREGSIIACDSSINLMAQTQTDSFSDALEHLVHPDGSKHIQRYFEAKP